MGYEYYLWWWSETATNLVHGMLAGDIAAFMGTILLAAPFLLAYGVFCAVRSAQRIDAACSRAIDIIEGHHPRR